MIAQAGFAVFIFGNKKVGDKIQIADGMLKEFDIAKRMGKFIIPVGSTGSAAAEIYKTVKDNIGEYSYLVEPLDSLTTETACDKLVKLICEIIKKQQVV